MTVRAGSRDLLTTLPARTVKANTVDLLVVERGVLQNVVLHLCIASDGLGRPAFYLLLRVPRNLSSRADAGPSLVCSGEKVYVMYRGWCFRDRIKLTLVFM